MGIGRFLRRFSGLNKIEQANLDFIKKYISENRFKLIKRLLKEKKISIEIVKLNSSFSKEIEFPQVNPIAKNVDANDVNNDIKKIAEKESVEEFSKNAFENIADMIAPNLKGMEAIKKAAALQIGASQPIHILLLGDPSTGKTDILRSAFTLSPISSFGLGSGTSGVGLAVSVKGNDIRKGLLPLADKGICAIDELNLMKGQDMAALYNSMEKGFVTYDKGGNHYRFDSRAKILATANPKGDEFKGESIKELKEQIPFDNALLSRFHLVFLIRKPNLEQFEKITEKIVGEEKQELKQVDVDIIKSYIEYTNKIEKINFPKDMQKRVVEQIFDRCFSKAYYWIYEAVQSFG